MKANIVDILQDIVVPETQDGRSVLQFKFPILLIIAPQSDDLL